MRNVKNSNVMTRVLNSFFHVIGTKTSPAHAWLTLKIILQQLEYSHEFIKNVDVVDIEDVNLYLNGKKNCKTEFNIVDIQCDVVDETYHEEVGQAIQSLADKLKKCLGEKAGCYFMKEFKEELGEECCLIIKEMGVDLRIVDLQDELYLKICENYTLEDDAESNIAFIEKK